MSASPFVKNTNCTYAATGHVGRPPHLFLPLPLQGQKIENRELRNNPTGTHPSSAKTDYGGQADPGANQENPHFYRNKDPSTALRVTFLPFLRQKCHFLLDFC
jgi:hypothetical protein